MFDSDSFSVESFSTDAFYFSLTAIAWAIRRMFEVGIEQRKYIAGL